MPKKAVASKSMELDKKMNAIKGEIDQIIEEVEMPKPEIEQEPVAHKPEEEKEHIVAPEPKKKQPKIIEEIVEEEEEEEPIVIKKVVKKKPVPKPVEVAPPKVETRGRPRKNVEAPKPQPKIIQRQAPEPYQQYHQPQQQHRNRFDSDMVLNESSMELLRQDMRNEMKRRLMASLFDC
jgi:hypothetical protein